MKWLVVIGVLVVALPAAAQTEGKIDLNAKRLLKDSISTSFGYGIPAGIFIKNDSTAIAVAEPILFGIYGKQDIISQRPYKVYQRHGIWFIEGTLPEGGIDEKAGTITVIMGGTFRIIIDANSAEVLSITHGK